MKNIGFVLFTFFALLLNSCSKDNAKSYEGIYDVDLVWTLEHKLPGVLTITESNGALSINFKTTDINYDMVNTTFTAKDNGNDYFDVTPCNLCWGPEVSITSGEVSKVDEKISINLQLYDREVDWSVGCEINEI